MVTAELIRRGARRYRDEPAILCGDETLTFCEVDELANRIAHVLVERGVDRVGLLLGNGLHSVPMDFACAKAGIARVPLNPRLAALEQQAILAAAGAELLVADTDTSLDAEVLPLGELLERARRAPTDEPPVELEPETTALLIATSGTTGKLKLVRHTQASYAAVAANILANLLDPKPGEVMLHAASLIHASGTFVLPYWLRGGASAILPGFEPTGYLDALERHRATAINVVPTMLGALLQEPPRELPTLQTLVYGASPTPPALLRRAIDRFGPTSSSTTARPRRRSASACFDPRSTTATDCSHAVGRRSTARCGSTGRTARSSCARPSRRRATTATTSSTARRSFPTAGCGRATSAGSTTRASSISLTARRT